MGENGARLTSPHVEIGRKAYIDATHATPRYTSFGFSRVGKSIPPSVKRTSASKVFALLKQALVAPEIIHRLEEPRPCIVAKKKAIPQICKRVRKVAANGNSTSQVSNRL